jgi:hypothetical protein
MARRVQLRKMSALSLQQPNAEQILRGIKKIEYRSRPTTKRERVYIYASLKPAASDAWKKIGLTPGDLPTGVLVGTVEIVGCSFKNGEYNWTLANPIRLKTGKKPKNHPQPLWFFPF